MGADRSALAALSAVAVLFAALLATTAGGLGPVNLASSSSQREVPPAHQGTGGATAGNSGSQKPALTNGSTHDPSWPPSAGQFVLIFALALVVLTVLATFRVRLLRRRKIAPGHVRLAIPTTDDDDVEGPPESLQSLLDVQLSALDAGTPRNAIVAAWVQLEDFAENHGLPRRRPDTPAEFVARALATYNLDQAVIERLADLYREARFSTHVIQERQREDARTCLKRLVRTEVSP